MFQLEDLEHVNIKLNTSEGDGADHGDFYHKLNIMNKKLIIFK